MICVEQPLLISPCLQEKVDKLWEEERRKNSHLFDGVIFSAVDISSTRLLGHWVSYRYALAVYRQPLLAEELRVNPVAVNGFSVASGHVLLARREANVSQYPGCWELAPSGGIDPKAASGTSIDYRCALLTELEEETGIDRAQVTSIDPFVLVFDSLTGSWEMVLKMPMTLDIEKPMRSSEYSEFIWVELVKLETFLNAQPPDGVVPFTRVMAEIMS